MRLSEIGDPRPGVELIDGVPDILWCDIPGGQKEAEPGEQLRRYGSYPADNVSWFDATAFCRWLSAKLGFEVRLPDEWEWQ